MIHSILIFNQQGKIRFSRFYQQTTRDNTRLSVHREQKFIQRAYESVHSRHSQAVCNFINLKEDQVQIVYRNYATLYVCIQCCLTDDNNDNEHPLAVLDLIQVLVECLNSLFNQNVCELDLVMNWQLVHACVDELVMGGVVIETDSNVVLRNIVHSGNNKY